MSSDVVSSGLDESPGADEGTTPLLPRQEPDGGPPRRSGDGRRRDRGDSLGTVVLRTGIAVLENLRNRRTILGVEPRILVVLLIPALYGVWSAFHWTFGFSPDSRYYTIMTLRNLGESGQQALTNQHHLTGYTAEPWYFSSQDPTWRMVQIRILYPFLAMPFVYVFGTAAGMLVIPALAMLTAVVSVAALAQRLYGPFASLIAGGAMVGGCLLPGTAMIWALTDPVAVGLMALLLLFLPLGRRSNGRDLLFLGMLTVLLSFTRQVMPVLVGMTCLAWFWAFVFPPAGDRRFRNRWFAPTVVVSGVALAFQVLGSLAAPYDASKQFLYASDNKTMGEAVPHIPGMAFRLLRSDFLGMAHGNAPLVFLSCAALALPLVKFRDPIVGLYFGALAGVTALVVANGVPSGMRYELVMLPVGGLGLAALVHRVLPRATFEAVPAGSAPAAPAPAPHGPSGRREVAKWGVAWLAGMAVMIGWSATHGAKSLSGAVPTSPAAAAALADNPATSVPITGVDGVETVKAFLANAVDVRDRKTDELGGYLDWRHTFQYRPADDDSPGWSDRAADGTTVVQYGDFMRPQVRELADDVSRDGTVDGSQVSVVSRQAGVYGEDLVLTVTDDAGVRHRVIATVVYLPHTSKGAGIVTQFVYES